MDIKILKRNNFVQHTLYEVIRVTICNNLIARTDVSQSLPEEDRMHVIGNAKFIRALVYFDLCLLGDNVLLWTNIDEVAKIARHEAILQQVIEDLEFANEWVINRNNFVQHTLYEVIRS